MLWVRRVDILSPKSRPVVLYVEYWYAWLAIMVLVAVYELGWAAGAVGAIMRYLT